MTLKLLVDTCVWLDLSKDYRNQPILSVIEDLVREGAVELAVPQIVLDEFQRNKDRVKEDAQRSLQAHFRLVREAVNRFADADSKTETLNALNEVDHRIAVTGDAINDALERTTRLLSAGPLLATTDAIKQRVTERALAKKAPYHHSKNSVGDAIIIELYSELASSVVDDGHTCAFVTHNVKDFSDAKGDRRNPHEDLAELFDAPKSTYWVSLVDAIKAIAPELLDDHEAEFNFTPAPRRLSEILEAEHLLFRQVWYNRHWNLRSEIEDGLVEVVSEDRYSRSPYNPKQILDTVWAGALASAKRTEDEVGLDNLGPWSDFDWGMINGKLSALRWVLGDEWDMLDT